MTMGSDIKGFEAREPLKQWEFLLEEWLFLNEKFCRIYDGEDTIFDYNERPNVGVLSSAAWRCGWLSIEEFSWNKSINGEKIKGRADLWFTENGDHETFIEAKHCKLSLNSPEFVRGIKNHMDLAYADAINTKNGDGNIASVGLLFARVYVKNNSSAKELRDKINTHIESIKENIQYDALGYFFPKQRLVSVTSEDYHRLGVILLALKAKNENF